MKLRADFQKGILASAPRGNRRNRLIPNSDIKCETVLIRSHEEVNPYHGCYKLFERMQEELRDIL